MSIVICYWPLFNGCTSRELNPSRDISDSYRSVEAYENGDRESIIYTNESVKKLLHVEERARCTRI